MKTEKVLGAGALTAGFLASLCCVGPIVFAALGLGVFSAGAVIEPLRPYLALTLAVCGIGGLIMAYRKKEVACEDGSCKTESASKGTKIMLWLMLAGGIAFYFSPSFL